MRKQLRFNGYLTKYLRRFDLQWKERRGWLFSMTCWSKFKEIHSMLRHWEHDELSPEEMLECIESCAVDLQNYRNNPDWNTVVTCNILLFVHIHALLEARGMGMIGSLNAIARKSQCREISKILIERANKMP